MRAGGLRKDQGAGCPLIYAPRLLFLIVVPQCFYTECRDAFRMKYRVAACLVAFRFCRGRIYATRIEQHSPLIGRAAYMRPLQTRIYPLQRGE